MRSLDRSIVGELQQLNMILETLEGQMRSHYELLDQNGLMNWVSEIEYVRRKIQELESRSR